MKVEEESSLLPSWSVLPLRGDADGGDGGSDVVDDDDDDDDDCA